VKFTETDITGAFLIDLEPRIDERGFFSRYFCANEFSDRNLNANWVQINNSMTLLKGTVRGLHMQVEPHAEVKLVRCIQGAAWDVIVDLRIDSPTFGKWFGTEINAVNRTMVYVPKGFAHGFATLTDNCELLYLVSAFYHPESERSILWNDKDIAIEWPIEVKYVSEKDRSAMSLQKFSEKILTGPGS
jgi:dTDP-4-dehydrorhamnose 3,5-epimerase